MTKEDLKNLIIFSKTLRVLFVEDNDKSRESALKLFKNWFDFIVTAKNGEEGLEKFEKENFDLIISDIEMPIINGVEMLSSIRETNKNIPFIVLSAYNESNYFMDTIKLGVDGYLIKPINLDQLIYTFSKIVYKLKLENDNLSYKNNLLNKIKQQEDKLISQSRFAAMGEMIAMIAHQWRQPLNVLSLNISNIQMMINTNKMKKSKLISIVENSEVTIDYMSRTIEDFRDFLKDKSEEIEVNILDLVNKPKYLVQAELEAEQINFILNSTISKTKRIVIDSSKFYQVVLNIYKNAIDEFKLKDIKNPTITTNIDIQDNQLIIKISDNAGGILQDIIQDIFNPYFSTKGKNGTGIGLYMSKKIIQDTIKGEILVENSKDGALFTIKIPLQQKSFFESSYKSLKWDKENDIFIRDKTYSNNEFIKESAEIIKMLDSFYIDYEVYDSGDIKVLFNINF